MEMRLEGREDSRQKIERKNKTIINGTPGPRHPARPNQIHKNKTSIEEKKRANK